MVGGVPGLGGASGDTLPHLYPQALGEFRAVPLRAGDYVAFPVGEETAHQIINSSTGVLRYLCMSTMIEPELVKYPDTNKIGVVAGRAPAPVFRAIFRLGGEPVDYWDGEK